MAGSEWREWVRAASWPLASNAQLLAELILVGSRLLTGICAVRRSWRGPCQAWFCIVVLCGVFDFTGWNVVDLSLGERFEHGGHWAVGGAGAVRCEGSDDAVGVAPCGHDRVAGGHLELLLGWVYLRAGRVDRYEHA